MPILHGALSPVLASGLLARAIATSSVCSVYVAYSKHGHQDSAHGSLLFGAESARGYRGFRILCAGRCSWVV